MTLQYTPLQYTPLQYTPLQAPAGSSEFLRQPAIAPLPRPSNPPTAPRAGAADNRRTLRSTQDDDAGLTARLVEVRRRHRGTFYEVTVKARGQAELMRTFSSRANADLVFDLAEYGVTDLRTPVLDLPRAFWRDDRDRANRVLRAVWQPQPRHGAPPPSDATAHDGCRCSRCQQVRYPHAPGDPYVCQRCQAALAGRGAVDPLLDPLTDPLTDPLLDPDQGETAHDGGAR